MATLSTIFKSRFGKVLLTFCLTAVVVVLVLTRTTPSPPQDSSAAKPAGKSAALANARIAPIPTATRAELDSFGKPDGSESEQDLLKMARDAVARSPAQALEWARSQSDEELRERLLLAVVRAWGEKDPRDAVGWALRQEEVERIIRMEAALTGAATQPELALAILRELRLREDEVFTGIYDMQLIGALSASGKFAEALRCINEDPKGSHTQDLGTVFRRWGQANPTEALKALTDIHDPAERNHAFYELADGWALNNPSMLATFATSLSAGPDRDYALNTALSNWSLQDPAAMGEWLNSLPPSPEFDKAIALLVTKTDSVNRSPEIAMSWIAGMADGDLRHESLQHVLRQWIESDSTAAWNYFKEITWIGAIEREELQNNLQKNTNLLQNTDPD
jgi:hypothetical protein